jgi:hypothetical protein
MIHELTHERRASSVCDVIWIVDAQGRIGDQGRRTLAEVVFGVEQAAGFTNLHQRRLERV